MGGCSKDDALKFARLGVQWGESMLTGIKIAFLGGDARMMEVILYAGELDASTYLFGFEQADLAVSDMHKLELTADALADMDAVVMPVAGMDDDGFVQAQFAKADLQLGDEHFAALRKTTPIFTGVARPVLSEMARRHGLPLIKLMEMDEVAILNSIPTAEGCIALAMDNTDITLHGSTCVVLGMGRCGTTLARMLAGLGAHVRVCSMQPSDLARAYEMGLYPYSMLQLRQAVKDADVIFNSIPAPVLIAEILTSVSRSALIIDFATAPGGTDFRYAERRGIKALLAPSLPGIVAPKTSGRIIAQTIVRLIQEQPWATGGM